MIFFCHYQAWKEAGRRASRPSMQKQIINSKRQNMRRCVRIRWIYISEPTNLTKSGSALALCQVLSIGITTLTQPTIILLKYLGQKMSPYFYHVIRVFSLSLSLFCFLLIAVAMSNKEKESRREIVKIPFWAW